MNKEKLKLQVLKAFTAAISVLLTFILLVNAGLENPFENVSFSIILLWVICFTTFEKLATKIGMFFISIISNDTTVSS